MPYLYGVKTCLNNANVCIPEVPGVEPVAKEKLHITILYVGSNRPRGVAEKVSSKLRLIKPFKIVIGPEIELLPSISKPKALALMVTKGVNKLSTIRSAILSVLQEHNIKIEDRFIHNFNPHLTIGLVRAKLDPVSAEELLSEIKSRLRGIRIEVTIDKVDLVDSSGGIYKVIETYQLGD